MTRWDIQPSGVRDVLHRTHGVAGEFEGQMKNLNSAMQGAASQSSSDIVVSALSGLADAQRDQIQFVFTRTGACINAAAQATNHYVHGDLEMAANAQASATAAPDPRNTMPVGGGKTSQ